MMILKVKIKLENQTQQELKPQHMLHKKGWVIKTKALINQSNVCTGNEKSFRKGGLNKLYDHVALMNA